MVCLHSGHALFFLVFHQDLIMGIRFQIIDAIDNTVGLFIEFSIYINLTLFLELKNTAVLDLKCNAACCLKNHFDAHVVFSP